jgi:hypothetical protein
MRHHIFATGQVRFSKHSNIHRTAPAVAIHWISAGLVHGRSGRPSAPRGDIGAQRTRQAGFDVRRHSSPLEAIEDGLLRGDCSELDPFGSNVSSWRLDDQTLADGRYAPASQFLDGDILGT